MQLSFRNNSAKIFYLLLATDIVFFGLHLFFQCKQFGYFSFCNKFSNRLFSISTDLGYAEFFQYIKEYWIILLLGVLAWQNKSLLYLTWSALFGYLLLDDAGKIHEKGGRFISDSFGFVSAFGLRRIDFGELIVSAFFGILFFIIIALAYRFSKRDERKNTKSLIVMLLVLAFFGIAGDMFEILVRTSFLKHFMPLIEDGGEHLAMSIIVWFVYDLFEPASQNILVCDEQDAIASPN